MQNERRRQGSIRFVIQKLCQSGLRIPICVKMFPLRSMQSSQLITKKWNIREVRNHKATGFKKCISDQRVYDHNLEAM